MVICQSSFVYSPSLAHCHSFPEKISEWGTPKKLSRRKIFVFLRQWPENPIIKLRMRILFWENLRIKNKTENDEYWKMEIKDQIRTLLEEWILSRSPSPPTHGIISRCLPGHTWAPRWKSRVSVFEIQVVSLIRCVTPGKFPTFSILPFFQPLNRASDSGQWVWFPPSKCSSPFLWPESPFLTHP